ncbi:unnamed protein product [Peniophora sp. CBMAI 1063]|nr:unnamed protein product [Peniophora sp. CBMAI 1063]
MFVNRRPVERESPRGGAFARKKVLTYDDEYFESLELELELQDKARAAFRERSDWVCLRSEAGWVVRSTPACATHEDFRRGHMAHSGVAAEALALVFYYMAAVEHLSGDEIERYWRAVDYYFEKRQDDPYDEGLWHNDEGEWRGNPATSQVVCLAINRAHQLDAEIEPNVRKAARAAFLEREARARAREAAAKAQRLEYVEV